MKEILVLIIIFKLWGIGIELKFLEVVVHLLVPFISFHLKSLEFTFIKCTVRPGYIFIIPTVKRLRQEDFVHLRPPCAIYSQFWAWWGYVGTPYLNKTKNKLLFLNHHLTVKGCKELQFCIKKTIKILPAIQSFSFFVPLYLLSLPFSLILQCYGGEGAFPSVFCILLEAFMQNTSAQGLFSVSGMCWRGNNNLPKVYAMVDEKLKVVRRWLTFQLLV